MKTGLAGGAVYYSREEGIWNENTEQVYERYATALQPHLASVKQQIPVEVIFRFFFVLSRVVYWMVCGSFLGSGPAIVR